MKKTLTSLALSLAAVVSLQAGGGLFDTFAIVRTASDTFYDAGAISGNDDFQGFDLGSFDASTDNLQLGGQTKTFKNNGTDVTGATINYRIWQGTEGGGFTSLAYAFQINDVGGTPGDQQWGTDVAGSNPTAFYTSNLISGLSAGNYTLEVFTEITTNSFDAPATYTVNNGGLNYEATFTIVPEPSAFALIAGLLGLSFVALKRRRA